MKRIASVPLQSCRVCSSKLMPLAQWLGASIRTILAKESPKKPNWLSRRHSWNSIAGRIASTDNNFRLSHAYRLNELIESSCV